MRILVLCPHFAPDTAPTGEVMTRIVDELGTLGHRLHVVTSLPWYEHHRIEPDWRGESVHHVETPWGVLTRVHPFPSDKTNLVSRALGFAGFTALSGLTAAVTNFRPEVVLAMSPPLTLGPAAIAIARMRRIPVVFNVQDIFPDVAIELGMMTSPTVVASARKLEQMTYAMSDAVTVLSDDLAANVQEKLPSRATTSVRVIPNFVDTARIVPTSPENAYRAELGLSGKKVVLYAGNIGFSQSLDLVVHAAQAFVDDESVAFVINGQGSARADVERAASSLPNVHFVDFQPRERLAEVLAAGDIHVIPLRKGLARSSVPSKTYSILAAGRPFVASVDEGTEVDLVAQRSKAGIAVPPDDPEAFTNALGRLLADNELTHTMGVAGRAWVESWASPSAVASAYGDLFRELVDNRTS